MSDYRKLPFVGLDDVQDYSGSGLFLVNRIPDSGGTGADKNTSVEFWLMCTVSGRAVDNSTVNVWVKRTATASWEQVIQNGSFVHADWGGYFQDQSPSLTDRRIVLIPLFDFDSEATVSVRVTADVDGGGGYSIDETWSFTIEDYVAPQMASALGWQPTKVRVAFDEPMGASAAVYTNYALAPYQNDKRGVVTPDPVACVQISTTVFEVEFEYELNAGAQYTITASGVYDDSNNLIDPAADSAVFTAYDYRDAERTFRGWQMYEQLSEYDRRSDVSGDLERLVTSHQYHVDVALKDIDEIDHLTNPDRAPFDYLRALMYDLGDPLPFITDERQIRRVAWRAVELHKRRGTAAGIKLAVELVTGLDCEVVHDRDRRWKLGYSETSVLLLVNDLYAVYEGHRDELGGVHGAADETNVITATAPATNLSQCFLLTNNIKLNYEGHRDELGGVHGAADTTNVVTAADSTDCYTCALLANNLRMHLEAHRVLTAGGVHGAEDTVNTVSQPFVGNRLGYDTILGFGTKDLFSFWLQFDQALTADQRALVARVVEVTRTAHTRYLGTIEP